MILLFGFGGVGRTYAQLAHRHGLRIAAIFDSGGGVASASGFTGGELARLLEAPRGGVSRAGVGRPVGLEEALAEAEVVVDVSPPNYATGEPALSLYRRALAAGRAVVTANKAPLALRFRELAGPRLYYKATVMAGTPLIDLALGLRPQRVEYVRGILNGSTNYVLTRVYRDGVDFDRALEEARQKGILEPDPSLDLEGVDAAAKLVILANALGASLSLGDVRREPLRPLGPVTKYVAWADLARGEAAVGPVRLDPGDPLASVDYTLNAVEIGTEVNSIFLRGKGAGRAETAYALLNDTLRALGR